MPNTYPCDGIFNQHLTTIKDLYIPLTTKRKKSWQRGNDQRPIMYAIINVTSTLFPQTRCAMLDGTDKIYKTRFQSTWNEKAMYRETTTLQNKDRTASLERSVVNPHLPSGLFHPYQLDESISNFCSISNRKRWRPIRRCVLWPLIWICTDCIRSKNGTPELYGLEL